MKEKVSKCTFAGELGEFKVKINYQKQDYSVVFFSNDGNFAIFIKNRAKLAEIVEDRGKILLSQVFDKELSYLRNELDKRIFPEEIQPEKFDHLIRHPNGQMEKCRIVGSLMLGKTLIKYLKPIGTKAADLFKNHNPAKTYDDNYTDAPHYDIVENPVMEMESTDLGEYVLNNPEQFNYNYRGLSCRILTDKVIKDVIKFEEENLQLGVSLHEIDESFELPENTKIGFSIEGKAMEPEKRAVKKSFLKRIFS